MSSSEIFIDSDGFVSYFFPDDVNHQKASRIFNRLQEDTSRLVTTNLVLYETATILSYWSGQAAAFRFLKTLRKIKLPIYHVDYSIEYRMMAFFKKQKGKGISVVDCANVVVMKRCEISTIFSFNEFYSKQPGIQTVEEAGVV